MATVYRGLQDIRLCVRALRSLIFSSTLWGKDCASHFAAGETSLHLLLGRFPHPLASAANCLPPCSQQFRFLPPHPPRVGLVPECTLRTRLQATQPLSYGRTPGVSQVTSVPLTPAAASLESRLRKMTQISAPSPFYTRFL